MRLHGGTDTSYTQLKITVSTPATATSDVTVHILHGMTGIVLGRYDVRIYQGRKYDVKVLQNHNMSPKG